MGVGVEVGAGGGAVEVEATGGGFGVGVTRRGGMISASIRVVVVHDSGRTMTWMMWGAVSGACDAE